jgi:hypothetical protein
MKEKVDELLDGIKERLKSNFLLTFIVIWLIRHWVVVFTIFNFDSYYFLDSKVTKLKVYFESEGFLGLWLCPVFFSILSIISYYALSGLSEYLHIKYENLRKWIYRKWDNKKIKTIEEYDAKVQENKLLQIVIREGEERRNSLLITNKNLEENQIELQTKNKSFESENTILSQKIRSTGEELEKWNNENKSLRSQVTKLSTDLHKQIDLFSKTTDKNLFRQPSDEFIKMNYQKEYNEWLRSNEGFQRVWSKSNDREKFIELFKEGRWKNEHTYVDGKMGVEEFYLEALPHKISFFTSLGNELVISDIAFVDHSTLSFTKTNPKVPNSPMRNVLRILSYDLLTGTENSMIEIVYKRMET